MKNNRWKYYLSLLFVVMLVGVACSTGEGGNDTPRKVSIAYLKLLCRGSHHTITEECYIRGVVVANDWLGEYQKSVVVVDESGGVEIAIASNSLYSWLPVYSEVEIFCGGRTLARVGGKVAMGDAPTQDFMLDNIEEAEAQRIVTIVGIEENFTPVKRRISELQISDIGSVVWIEGLRIVEEEQGLLWCDVVEDVPATTIRTLIDREGNTIGVQTLASCVYGENKIPTTEFSVVGVVDAANGECFLRIINGEIL